MKLKQRIGIAAIFAAVIAVTTAFQPAHSPADPAPIRILSIGDSISHGCAEIAPCTGYRGELTRLLNLAGIPHEYTLDTIPGAKCTHWPVHMGWLIDRDNPDLILLNCGTNDTPSDNTEAAMRSILSTVTARNVPTVISWITYPDMRSATNTSRPWIDDWHKNTNDAIFRAKYGYGGPVFNNVAIADMQRIPSNLIHLETDGVHPTDHGDDDLGWLFYEAAANHMGWPSPTTLGQPRCGLSGNWLAYPEPVPYTDYTPCTQAP